MVAPAPGTMPISMPKNAVQTVCHQYFALSRNPSNVSAQRGRAWSTADFGTIVSRSSMENVSAIANRPIRAAMIGIPS